MIKTRSITVNPDSYPASRSDIKYTHNGWVSVDPGSIYRTVSQTPISVPAVLRKTVETIDTVDSVKGSDRFIINPCTHTKLVPTPIVSSNCVRRNGISHSTAVVYPSGWVGAGVSGKGQYRTLTIYNDDISNLMQAYTDMTSKTAFYAGTMSAGDPWAAMSASLRPIEQGDRLHELPARVVKHLEGVHLTTTLIEARELPALYQMFTRRSKLLSLGLTTYSAWLQYFRSKKIWGWGTDAGELAARKGRKNLLRLLREGQLGYSFGLAPTVRDALQISNELANYKPRKKQFSVTIASDSSTNTDRNWRFARPGPDYTGSEKRSVRQVWGVRLRARRTEIDYGIFSEYATILDRFIGKNPLGLIWEVMPLSFAVDWLISVDDALDTLWLNKQEEYDVAYWSSVKRSIDRTCIARVASSFHGYSPGTMEVDYQDQQSVSLLWSYYSRTPRAAPSVLSTKRLRGLNVYNVYLGFLIATGLASFGKKGSRIPLNGSGA